MDEYGGLHGESHVINAYESEEFQLYHNSILQQHGLFKAHILYDQLCQFINQFQHFYDQHKYNGVSKCLELGMAFPNESFAQWNKRHDYEELSEFTSRVLALYGNVPVLQAPACQVLMMLSNKMPSIIGPLLQVLLRQFTIHSIEPMNLDPKLPDVAHLWLAGMHLEGISSFYVFFQTRIRKFFSKCHPE